MLVVNETPICLRLRALLVAGILVLVAGGHAAAQDAQSTDKTPGTAQSETPEQSTSEETSPSQPQEATSSGAGDPTADLPPIEITQPVENETAPEEAAKETEEHAPVIAARPVRYQPPAYGGGGSGEAAGATGPADIPGDADGTGESAWGPVDGFVATRTVSGIKTDTPITEVPQSVSVITADRMEQLGANTLPEALGYTAGVRPSTYGSDSRYDWLSIRGFDAYYPGIYFDGMFARNNNTWAAWKVEPYGAERIEVLKGPSSVLYGQMNPGGTVNVITKRPTEQTFYEAGVEMGNFGRVQPFFDFGGPTDESGTVLYRVTGLGLKTGTQVENVSLDTLYFAPALTLKPTNDTTLTILAHYLERETGVTSNFLPAEGTLLPNPNGKVPTSFHSGDPNFDSFRPTQKAISYFLDHRVNDTWELRQNARYGTIDLEYDSLYGTGLDPFDPTQRLMGRRAFFSDENVDQFIIDNQAEANFFTGAIEHTMLFGVDYQWNHFDQTSGDGPSTPIDMFSPSYGGFFPRPPLFNNSDTDLTQTGLYAQEQAKLWDRLVLVAGGRYDWSEIKVDDYLFGNESEQKDEAFSWRTGAVYVTPSGFAPYVSYSTSFLPTAGFDPFTGNPFDPETGRQYEGGIKFQPPGRESLITFSAFDIRKQNYLTYDNLFNPRQTGEILSRGLEFETVAQLTDGLDLIAAYTWLPEFTITQSADINELGKREPAVAEHWGSLWAHYTIQHGRFEGFGFGAGVRYIGETYGDSINSARMIVPAFTLIDAAIDYETEHWRFAVNAHNLADKEYVASCWDTCYYGEPRTVIGTITRRW